MDLKKELDRVFSIFTRLMYADFQWYCECYTCSVRKLWSEMQLGHFKRREFTIVRYDKDNCRPQCPECNCSRDGMAESFEEHLRDELGDERVDELIKRSSDLLRFSNQEYKDLIHSYKLQIKEMGVIM